MAEGWWQRQLALGVVVVCGCQPLENTPPGWLPIDGDVYIHDTGPTADGHDGETANSVDTAACQAAQCAPANQQGCIWSCDSRAGEALLCLRDTCTATMDACLGDPACLSVVEGALRCASGCTTSFCRDKCVVGLASGVPLAACGWTGCWPDS